jgi:hypothetical protein
MAKDRFCFVRTSPLGQSKEGPEARAITGSSACSIGLSETETYFFSDNP